MTIPTRDRRWFLQRAAATSALLGVPALLAACGGDDGGGGSAGSTGPSSTGGGTAGATTTVGSTTTTALEQVALSVLEPFPLVLMWIAETTAVSTGIMERNGLDLDLQFARSAPQALQQLAAGSVVLCGNGPLAVVRAISQEGAPFKAVATTVQETIYRLVSTTDQPFDDPGQLAGAKVGFPTLGGNAEDVFNLMARAAGVDPGDVERVAVGNDAASLTFVDDGRVDLIFATQDAAASMQAAGLPVHVVKVEGTNPLLGTALVATTEGLERHREGIVRYIRGLHEAMTLVAEPDRIAPLLGQVRSQFELPQLDDPAKALPVIEAISTLWFAAGAENLLRCVPERWAEGVAGFEELGIAKPGSDPTSFYTNDLVDEATA